MVNATFQISAAVANYLEKAVATEQISSNYQSKIDKWKEGVKRPSYNQLLEISKQLKIPFGYLLLQEIPKREPELMKFRTIVSKGVDNASRELVDTEHDMRMIQAWMQDYLKRAGYAPRRTYKLAGANKDTFVKIIRKELNLEMDWYKEFKDSDAAYKFIRRKIESAQVLVQQNGIVGTNTSRILALDEFRAFALQDEYAPLIFINSLDSLNGRLFSLIHEFAHILLGGSDLYNTREFTVEHRVEEALCNAAAAEILVPDLEFIRMWEKHFEQKDLIKRIAATTKEFCCSGIVVARKALDQNRITSKVYAQYSQIIAGSFKRKKNKTPGGDFYNTQKSRLDGRFLQAIAYEVQAGRTRPMDAYRLTSTTIATFNKVVKRVMGERDAR